MRWLFFALMAVHGLIHFMGFAKGFGLANLPQLTLPISRNAGLAWLAAGLLMLVAAVLFVLSSRVWWVAGLAAVALSQAVIVSVWGDAKLGTVANVLVFLGVVYGFASLGPASFAARYRRAVQARLEGAPAASDTVTEKDLAGLPDPVQRYLRLTGAVDQPRVHSFGASWRGRIRGGPGEPWMSFTAKQPNFPAEPARFFLMGASRAGLPVDVFHAFQGGAATMKVRLLSLIPLVDAGGPEMTRAETVTLLNDMCLLAPAALLDAPVEWEAVDDHVTRVRYGAGTNTVTAEIYFNDAGELVDFVSDDRLAVSSDGKTFRRLRWSTPVGDYRSYGPRRAAGRGAGLWHAPEGEYAYIELELTGLEVNGEYLHAQPSARPVR